MAFRVTEAEKQRIEARRKRTGLNMRQYLLQAALGGKVYVVAELKPLLAELKAYGRNLNQLAILAHEGRIDVVNMRGAVEMLSKTYNAINSLYENTGEVISNGDM